MQRLWKQQWQWDERVPPDITLGWEQLAKAVQLVKDIKTPRFLFVDSDNEFHLFGFSDMLPKRLMQLQFTVALFQIQEKSASLLFPIPLEQESLHIVHLTFPRNSLTHHVLLFKQLSQGNSLPVQKMSRRIKERTGTGKERLYPVHKSHITQVTAS
ncbi:hypothetical protein TNCV_3745691 [Trichonephila clavipes]|nr:hypothetical protein TNCV_3745691 [Trichonephila clavipes]